MTREEQLIAMNGTTLIMLADKLGVKVRCNRTRSALKEAKKGVVDRILAAENAAVEDKPEDQAKPEDQVKPADQVQTPPAEIDETEKWEDDSYEDRKKQKAKSDKAAEDEANKKKPATPKKSSGRNAQIEYDGRSQNICAWAKELGISANTLYGRIYKMGWSVEKAFMTPSSRQTKQADKPRA